MLLEALQQSGFMLAANLDRAPDFLHDLLVVAGPGNSRRLQHQRGEHQLLFSGRAGADEQALQLRSRERGHALDVVRRKRHRDLRLEVREVHFERLRVGRSGIGPERPHRLRRLGIVRVGPAS